MNSKLPVDILGRIWELSDIDKDGYLDRDEFALVETYFICILIFQNYICVYKTKFLYISHKHRIVITLKATEFLTWNNPSSIFGKDLSLLVPAQ